MLREFLYSTRVSPLTFSVYENDQCGRFKIHIKSRQLLFVVAWQLILLSMCCVLTPLNGPSRNKKLFSTVGYATGLWRIGWILNWKSLLTRGGKTKRKRYAIRGRKKKSCDEKTHHRWQRQRNACKAHKYHSVHGRWVHKTECCTVNERKWMTSPNN